MVYDVFTLNNELDMLEIRLNILSPYVDKFVIVEATETFSGKPKPFYYAENKERFKQWESKIIHHVIDDYPLDDEVYEMARNSTNTGNKEHWWMREFYQKEKIKDALKGLDDEDICFVSDLDEVWNYNLKLEISDEVFKLMQDWCYVYYLNQRTNEDNTFFTGTIVTKYKNIKNACLNHLRTKSKTNYVWIKDGGWHFNALGGRGMKMGGFQHPVYTHEYMDTRENGKRVDETGLPEYILNNKEKWKQYLL